MTHLRPWGQEIHSKKNLSCDIYVQGWAPGSGLSCRRRHRNARAPSQVILICQSISLIGPSLSLFGRSRSGRKLHPVSSSNRTTAYQRASCCKCTSTLWPLAALHGKIHQTNQARPKANLAMCNHVCREKTIRAGICVQ